MMRRCITVGPILGALLLATALPARGQEASQGLDPCVAAYRDALGSEERFFRTVIYGQPSAANARSGTVRYDSDGNAWVKIAPNSWRSLGPGTAQRSDAQMGSDREHPDRHGLVEIREALTSEAFITPATQSLRALRCRMAAVCQAAEASEFADSSIITVQPLGCLPVEMPVFAACDFSGRATEGTRNSALANCYSDVSATMLMEADLLRMTSAYDSGYRSLLQFSGSFEGFIDDVRDPILQPMQRAVDMFLELRQLPCFISECNG